MILTCFLYVIKLRSIAITLWIDVCPTDANLLVSGGTDCDIKIYDRRESKIVKIFAGIHSGKICLDTNNIIHLTLQYIRLDQMRSMEAEWDMLATASHDKSAEVIESKTRKVIHSRITPDGRKTILIELV